MFAIDLRTLAVSVLPCRQRIFQLGNRDGDNGVCDEDALLFWDMVTLAVFCVLFITFNYYAYIYSKQERENARERWIEANETRGEEDEDNGWGREDAANLMKKFQNHEVVISPELGRGQVVLKNHKPGMEEITVAFDILNENRLVAVKDLLFVGMRLRHAKRGLGTIDLFDFVEERAHVKFDSGEYHRYLLNSWKSKMIARERYARKKKTFERFFQDYLFYRIDYVLSNFTFAKPMLLSFLSLSLIILGAILYALASGTRLSESTWVAWTLVASSGSQASINQGAIVRSIAASLTLGGMLVFALVIGLMADGVSNLLDELKQGHALVIQTGHTLILGWSDKTIPVVRELCLANQKVVVILAERPKSEMEDELNHGLSKEELRKTLVIFRSGNPSMQEELNKVSAGSAKSVIVLADGALSADESDARVVRCVLSLQGVRTASMGHIVVEMCDVDNRDLALLADAKNVEVVVAHDLIGRLMIQSAREPGLSHVLEKLLGFENQQFFLHRFPELEQCTFGEILFRFEDAIPIGIKPWDRYTAYQTIRNSKWRKRSLMRRDWDGKLRQGTSEEQLQQQQQYPAPKSFYQDAAPIIDHFEPDSDEEDAEESSYAFTRRVILNPPNDYVLQPGDEIMFISTRRRGRRDGGGDAPRTSNRAPPTLKPFSILPKSAHRSYVSMKPAHRPIVLNKPEHFLFCGWRRDVDDIILELDLLVCRGSRVTILCDTDVEERVQRFEQGGMDVSKLRHITVEHLVGNWTLRRDLERIPLKRYGSIFILADQSLEDDTTRCDSKSLASLLFIRDIISRQLNGTYVKPAPLLRQASVRRFHSSGSVVSTLDRGNSAASSSSSGILPPSPRKSTLWAEEEEAQSPRAPEPPHGAAQTVLRKPSLVESRASTLERQITQRFTQPPTTAIADKARMLQDNGGGEGGSDNASFYVKRHSPVGQDLFFENKTGSTILISEILDANTKALIPGTNGGVGDYVMSNEAVACALAMVSECRDVNVVLNELLQAEGNDLHLRSALDYGFSGEKVDFWQLQARARARAEICIGFRAFGDRAPSVNPQEKSAKFVLHPKAMVIVLSEDNGGAQKQQSEYGLLEETASVQEEEMEDMDAVMEEGEDGGSMQQQHREADRSLAAQRLREKQQGWHLRRRLAQAYAFLFSWETLLWYVFPMLVAVATVFFLQNPNLVMLAMLLSTLVFGRFMWINAKPIRQQRAQQQQQHAVAPPPPPSSLPPPPPQRTPSQRRHRARN